MFVTSDFSYHMDRMISG